MRAIQVRCQAFEVQSNAMLTSFAVNVFEAVEARQLLGEDQPRPVALGKGLHGCK